MTADKKVGRFCTHSDEFGGESPVAHRPHFQL